MHLRATKKHNADVSMQDYFGMDKEGAPASLEDKLADDAENLADVVALKLQVVELYKAIEKLDPREQDIIRRRYGLAGAQEVTQREIGKQMNISRSYVSRIEKKVLGHLKKELSVSEG